MSASAAGSATWMIGGAVGLRLYLCHLVQSLMQTKNCFSIKASSASFYNGNGLVNLGSANSILGFDACHSDT